MALMKYEPFKYFEKFFEPEWPFVPVFAQRLLDIPIDLYQEKGNLIAEVIVPGLDPEKINITFQENLMKVTGVREEEKEIKEKEFFYKEIKRGSFERIVTLPAMVNVTKVEAHYKNGLLKVVMPLLEPPKQEKVKVTVH